MSRIEVAVASPLFQTLSYSCDPEKDGDPVGRRVFVPLSGRRVTGYVLGLMPEEDVDYRILPIIRFLDDRPLFPATLVPFFRWIADYYHYPIGEVIKTGLPGGLTMRDRKVISLTETGRAEPLAWPSPDGDEPPWFQTLQEKGGLTPTLTKKLLSDKTSRKLLGKLERQGLICYEEVLDQEKIRAKREVCYILETDLALPESIEGKEGRKALAAVAAEAEAGAGLTIPMVRTLFHLAALASEQGQEAIPVRDLRRLYSGASKALAPLEAQGLVRSVSRRIYRNPFGEALPFFSRPKRLSDEQEQVLEVLLPAVEKGEFHPFLLHGITGCGKTEVYLQAAAATLAAGRDVLVLVPEIALATQLEGHFVSRFGEQVVLLHSGLSPGERFDQWSLAAQGKARVVIGARSAVFAPLPDPGLIVVDEEHDAAFKQEDGLRYQGRDLAILRGRFNRSVVLLGSGTPAISSYASAREGKFTLLRMTRRVEDRPLPQVDIVDLRDKKEKARGEALGKRLREELAVNMEAGRQSILLLNRRGFSSSYLCLDCGEPVRCLHCHVSLSYHKKESKLVCHHCGYTLKENVLCGSCRSTQLAPVGFGTERIEQEVLALLPEARVARIDSDTAADRRNFLSLLRKMHQREIDILIGTQMIAKGHDFPGVTLVGVVWADGGLSMPDYRAAERTYQLLSQVTGRAGRGEDPGRVIIQTLRPEHYVVQMARDHEYEQLYEREMAIRQSPPYPPFVRLVNLRISGSKEAQVQQAAAQVAAFCRSFMEKGGEVLGPAPAPLEKIRDRYRWQVLVKEKHPSRLHALCRQLLDSQSQFVNGDMRITIDVDPENMM